MEATEKINEIQDKAVESWIKNNMVGTINAITGIGKTFIFLKALLKLEKGIRVLFLAEQINRKYELLKEIKKFDKLYGTNILVDYNMEFMTYQSAYKLVGRYWDFICADEIHDSLTPMYSMFYKNNKYKYIMGLTATIPHTKYEDKNGVEYSKYDLLRNIAPICFKYNIVQGQLDEVTRKLNIIVVEIILDDKYKYVKSGKKGNYFYVTERRAYEFWEESFNKAKGSSSEFLIRRAAAARAKLLYNLKSKEVVVKEILKQLEGKTLIFGNSLEFLEAITPNVISSKNKEEKNIMLREQFDNGNINVIASFKKLLQGVNLNKLDNVIITSYYSSEKDLIQRIGRLRRDNKLGNVIILRTKGTKEETWFNKMFAGISLDITTLTYENLKNIKDYVKQEETQ